MLKQNSMGNPRGIIITLVVTVLLIAGLGLWVAYRSGELTLPYGDAYGTSEEDYDYPRARDGEANQTMNMEKTNETNPVVVLKTSKGDVKIELYTDLMPVTAGNFLKLAQENFYDNTKFHRVIDGFMIQGGDPNSKGDDQSTYGTGGPGYAIADEHIADPKLSNMRGTISMANSGPNSGGSQFFINLVDNVFLDFDKQPLSSKHPVFGRVIEGLEVVDAIAQVPTGARDIPVEPVIVNDVVVE
jgi:cyclophilin family peptidyl-prolyl cis-trans isomerase